MPRRRGRSTQSLPIHPERVVSIAMQAGLSSTVRLQRAIKNKATEKHFRSSDRIWKIARQVYLFTKEQGSPDYSYILKAEPQIRDNNLKILNEKAAEFGHTEVQRLRNSDGTLGPHNQRQNACGAVLREYSEIEFPFPDPILFGTRTQRKGAKRRRFRVAGYEGTSFGPKVILSHPDLPSLDFGDSVRSHNEYLATYCTIHNVSVRETTRYSNLFLLLTRPSLEYIYSEYKYGKPGFRDGINEALSKVKDLVVQAGYQPTIWVDRSVTNTLEYDDSEVSMDFIDIQLNEAQQFYGNHPALDELKRLKNGGFHRSPGVIEPCLTEKDVKHIREKAIQRGKIKGSIMHRRIEHLFPTPWNLRDVIFRGHEYAISSGYVIVSELPLETDSGIGKVDITLLERVSTKDGKNAVHRPALVCEIKTRMGHKWYLDANQKTSQSRGKDGIPQRVVAEFPMSDRFMDDREWKSVVDSTPYKNAQKQVAIYADALTQRYQEMTGEEATHVLRATIIIEAIADINQVRRTIEGLIVKAHEHLKKTNGSIKRTVITATNDLDCKIALVIHKQMVKKSTRSKIINPSWNPPFNPFYQNQGHDRRFILYLTGESPTSSGASASYNSRNYHGLQMLYQIMLKNNKTKFLWLDLADQYTEAQLAEARLRLKPRKHIPEEEAKAHFDYIRDFFKGINVKGYLNVILSYLYEKGPEPSFGIKRELGNPLVVIVSGIDVLKRSTPESHRNQLQIVLDKLLANLPDDKETTVLWFDAPVPSAEKSIPYATRALLPYNSSSSLAEYATDIIWNLPSPPRSAVEPLTMHLGHIGDAPIYDDIRVLITHTSEELDVQFVSIPLLQGWSRRFKNQGRGLIISEREAKDLIPEKNIRERMKLLAITLIPWIIRLDLKMEFLSDSNKSLEVKFNELIQEFRGNPDDLTVSIETTDRLPNRGPSTLDLLRFRPPNIRSGKAYVAMTLGRINSQRLYRSPIKLRTKTRQITTTPAISDEITPYPDQKIEWLLGIKFLSDEDPSHPWWMVIQDPKRTSRMLVGCFLNRPVREGEILWSENKREILTCLNIDDILKLSKVYVVYSKTKQGLEVWHIDPNSNDRFHAGIMEVVRKGYSPVSQLQGISYISSYQISCEPPTDFQLSESFYQRCVDALKRYRSAMESPIQVTVQVKRLDDGCRVAFTDGEDVFQEVEIETTSDLISLLRLPVAKGGPMYTDSGEYVTWSIFDDIDYGELDFIGPYVTYTAARKTPVALPKRVSNFFDEAKSLSVSISHDDSLCPIVSGTGVEHESCWRIELPSNCPARVRKQLDRPLTGEEVNGLLAPGRLFVGKLYTLDFIPPTVSENDESVVFHEERYIRMLLRQHDIHLKQLLPGTFLHTTGQQWMVSIEWDGRYFKWQAQSTVSGLHFKGSNQTVELIHGRGAREECDRLLSIITSQIPQEQIYDYFELEKHVLTGLKNQGYSKKSPSCEFRFIEQSDNVCRYGIFLSKGSQRAPLESFSIEASGADDPDALLEEIMIGLSEGAVSAYNIVNVERFVEQLSSWINEHVLESEETGEEPVVYEVTLTLDDGMQSILWEAEEQESMYSKNGVLYDDLKVLLHVGIPETIREMREIFELDVVPHLGVISNLENVLTQQIPEMVRRIRKGRIQGY